MTDDRVSSNFWLSEFLRSDSATRHGVSNAPTPEAERNLRVVLAPGMQRIRDVLGTPIQITSGYRSPEVNRLVRGSKTSQHLEGLAADFVSPSFGTPRTVAGYLLLRKEQVRFDQLIFEGTWCHVSFVEGAPRGEVLTAHFTPAGVTYTKGLA
jgi:zinc D-Ala-D-Ala carboxypeptidase